VQVIDAHKMLSKTEHTLLVIRILENLLGALRVSAIIVILYTMSLSENRNRSEGKSGLKQNISLFEENNWLFDENNGKFWSNSAFPQ